MVRCTEFLACYDPLQTDRALQNMHLVGSGGNKTLLLIRSNKFSFRGYLAHPRMRIGPAIGLQILCSI